MAVKLTKEFYINIALFVVACVALGLSIWAFATPCKKDGFGNNNNNDCSYCKNDCPSKGKSVSSVRSLKDLNDMCKYINCDELGKIYVDTHWACSNVGEPADRHDIIN